MGYLLTEIVVYLVIAGLIGFAFGWAVKAGALDKYFDKLVEFINKTWIAIKNLFEKLTSSKEKEEAVKEEVVNVKSVNATTEDVKKTEETKSVEVAETVTEVIKEEIKDTIAEVVPEEVAPAKIAEEPIKEVVAETAVEATKELESEATIAEEKLSKPTLLTEAPEAGQDKLSSIKGIGPVLEKKLNELGVYNLEQIASWTTEESVWIGTKISSAKRVINEEWVNQAKELLKNK